MQTNEACHKEHQSFHWSLFSLLKWSSDLFKGAGSIEVGAGYADDVLLVSDSNEILEIIIQEIIGSPPVDLGNK